MEQQEPRRTESFLTFSTITFGFMAILYSWALFILLPGGMLVLASLPFCLFLIWRLSKSINRRGWRFAVRGWQRYLFWSFVLLLVVLAPIYSYLYGYYHATRLFRGLGIAAGQIDIDYELLDRLGDIGGERYFVIRYQVFEPLDEAEAKIRQRFENSLDWYVAGPNPNDLYPIVLTVDCMRPRYFGLIGAWNFPVAQTGITLQESGKLTVGFIYEQSRACTDIR
jgi:hypothetical protein